MDLARLQSLLAGAGAGAGAGDGDGSLVSFRAGCMTLSGTTVTADPRKGKVFLIEKDGLLHFQWRLRPSDEVKEDTICMPHDATFEKVDECKDGRVFLLDVRKIAHDNTVIHRPSSSLICIFCTAFDVFIAV